MIYKLLCKFIKNIIFFLFFLEYKCINKRYFRFYSILDHFHFDLFIILKNTNYT
jgi:hypothetical protein